MSRCRVIALALAVGLASVISTAAGSAASERADERITITLMTHDSFNVSKPVLRAFTRSTGVTVRVLRAGAIDRDAIASVVAGIAPVAQDRGV